MAALIRFDVNDKDLRQVFLREVLPQAIERLERDMHPGWGRMSAQQMVEHLVWAFDLSTGDRQAECTLAEDQRERIKAFLYDNRPSPRDFMNPALTAGLPPLQHAGLPEARAALHSAIGRFLDPSRPAGVRHTHPLFGPMDREEWSRTHFKHAWHHLSQFALIAVTEHGVAAD
jgi:oxepin-CoA hydrolase/3-oxo-5,6-dehydrosuberyl-CoA semialdehyde dehydrogenase